MIRNAADIGEDFLSEAERLEALAACYRRIGAGLVSPPDEEPQRVVPDHDAAVRRLRGEPQT